MTQNAILQVINETPVTIEEINLYQQIIGSSMYAMVVSRPNIVYTVEALARHMLKSQKEHWITVRHLLRSLNTTKVLEITYEKIATSGLKDIEVFSSSDSDWAGNHKTRKSTSSYIFTLNKAAITWSSRLQKMVALSSMEAEYMS